MPEFTIAFLGDIVGRPGRRVVTQQLPRLVEEHRPDLIVANAENARSGSGLTPSIYAQLRAQGIHAITLGDHVFRDQSIVPTLQAPDEPVARPANLSPRAPGKRFIRLPPGPGRERTVLIVTVLGRIFMPLPANDPFVTVDEVLKEVADPGAIVLVEAHTEATSEKIALAEYLRGRVAAVLGTHTHVPTADARVLPGGTAFITDVGMCGPYESIIGRDRDAVLKHMTTGLHAPFAVASGGAMLCGAVVRVSDDTARALSIERVEYRADYSRPPFMQI